MRRTSIDGDELEAIVIDLQIVGDEIFIGIGCRSRDMGKLLAAEELDALGANLPVLFRTEHRKNMLNDGIVRLITDNQRDIRQAKRVGKYRRNGETGFFTRLLLVFVLVGIKHHAGRFDVDRLKEILYPVQETEKIVSEPGITNINRLHLARAGGSAMQISHR